MKLLLETICCQDGQLQALPWHEARMRDSLQQLGGGLSFPLSQIRVPEHARAGRYKCRLLYNGQLQQTEFLPYRIRPVRHLRLMEAGHIDYSCKYADRRAIEALFAARGDADDILMVRNGYITDTSYANVALWDGAAWHTPATPMLPGTRRARLLQQNQLQESRIRIADLVHFQQIALFNAMMGLHEGPRLPVKAIL